MLDWDDLRTFLAIARHGSLSAGARSLRVAQTTVGRRLDRFERKLGARLFERRPSGFVLTDAGVFLRGRAERMEQEAISAERGVAGRDAGVRGSVRITASEWLAVRVIGPMLAPLLAQNPELAVELVADPRHLNLGRGEADLALRPSKFESDAVYARQVARLGFGLYASPEYLARAGRPDFTTGCEGHTVIAMSDDVGDVARAWLLGECKNARVAVRTNGREAMTTLAVAGVGMACLPRVIGDATPSLARLATTAPLPERQLWLGVHRQARSLPRVRAVSRFLVEELQLRQRALTPA